MSIAGLRFIPAHRAPIHLCAGSEAAASVAWFSSTMRLKISSRYTVIDLGAWMPIRTCLPEMAITVTDTSSPMRSLSPIRRVKINMSDTSKRHNDSSKTEFEPWGSTRWLTGAASSRQPREAEHREVGAGLAGRHDLESRLHATLGPIV
jgi:hypothetical protein